MQSLKSKFKSFLKTILTPVLPYVRSLRILPERLHARNSARAFRPSNDLSICYLTSNFPSRPALRSEISNGGAVKLTFLAESFPHSYPSANLLYTVSSVAHNAKTEIVRIAREKGLKIILNQNGVAYPAWKGSGWESINQKMQEIYTVADFIVYQSKFCELSAQKFLGPATVSSKIIYNPVDTNLYSPIKKISPNSAPVLLLGGNQYEKYRFEVAAQTLARTLPLIPGTRLIITGKLWGEDQTETMKTAYKYLQDLGIESQVEFTGSYSQNDAMQIFQRADILIHTKYNDPSPNLISEALAAGLPIVYSASGGVPELVGPDAGIGLPVELGWDIITHPDSSQMAAAIQQVWGNLSTFSEAARQRAVEQFSLEKFIRQHQELFSQLLG